jgi:MoxR-like ATPase
LSVSEPLTTPRLAPPDAELLRIAAKVREVGHALDERYLDKAELVRLLLVTLVAGEHMLIVGPPGTAKSALVRHLARLIDARYFEYLLTRFSEPNEIFGPIDIKAFREGTYVRRVEAMLPDADIVFLDEIFKSNSAILN